MNTKLTPSIIIILLFALSSSFAFGQSQNPDSQKNKVWQMMLENNKQLRESQGQNLSDIDGQLDELRPYKMQEDDLIYQTENVVQHTSGGLKLQTSYTHNAQGLRLAALTQVWESQEWRNDNRADNSYDGNENIASSTSQIWYEGSWVNNYRYTYTYDEQGNRLTSLHENGVYDEWENLSKVTYTFDENGNRESTLLQYWVNSDWLNSLKYAFISDANGNELSAQYHQWENNMWINKHLTTTTFTENGDYLSLISQDWVNATWENNYKYSHSYDSFGNLTSMLYQGWINEDWNNVTLTTNTYDNNGTRLTNMTQQWDDEDWVNTVKKVYTYDAEENKISELTLHWIFDEWTNATQIIFDYNYSDKTIEAMFYANSWMGENWFETDGSFAIELYGKLMHFAFSYHKIELSYATYISAIDDNKNGITHKTFCYPNPAKGEIYIDNIFNDNALLQVINITGIVVKETNLNPGENQISVQNLPKGIYLFRVQSGITFVQNKIELF